MSVRCACPAQPLHTKSLSCHEDAAQKIEEGITGNAEVSQPRTEMTQPCSSVGSMMGAMWGIPAFELCEVNSATLYIDGDLHCCVGGLQIHPGGSEMPL